MTSALRYQLPVQALATWTGIDALIKEQMKGTPVHREPLHAGADRVPWWELVPLASHVHPSVAAMARQLLAGAPVVYNGDPLRDLSLGNFLDAFVQRKPKVCTFLESDHLACLTLISCLRTICSSAVGTSQESGQCICCNKIPCVPQSP